MSTPDSMRILDTFFQQMDKKQVIAHQIESFNHFILHDVPEILQAVNPVIIRGSPEIPLSGPRSVLASATGLSTSAANALMGQVQVQVKDEKVDLPGAVTAGGGTQANVSDVATAPVRTAVRYEYEVQIEFEKPQLRKPTIFEKMDETKSSIH
jgi:hypothetical protein